MKPQRTATSAKARSVFARVKNWAAKNNFTGVIRPAKLRVEVYTSNGTQNYELSLKDNSPRLSNANTEVRLKEQDAFVFSRARMTLTKETSVLGIERLHTFPNLVTFPDESGGFQNAHLAAVYNGGLYMKVGDTVYLQDYSVQECYVAGTQQETASLKSERYPDDGWKDFAAIFALKGFENNELKFQMPNANSSQKVQYTDQATNGKVKLVFEFDGFVLTGAGTGNYNLKF